MWSKIMSRPVWSFIGQLSYILIPNSTCKNEYLEAAWPRGQPVRLAIQQYQIQVQLWQLTGFFLGHPEFKSSAMLVHVNSQLVTSYQLGFLILLCCV